MEGHHCRCSSWCQFYGMRPNDRCLSLSDEWTRSLEGCGGAVFDAHRLSFRILPVLETTCHRAAESQVVVDARRARTLDALPSIEYEHGANSGALAVVATDPSGARGLLRALALRRLQAFWDQGLTGMKTRSNGLKPIGSRHRPYIRTV